MIKIAINGYNGKMGQVVAEIVATTFSDRASVAYGIDIAEDTTGEIPVYAGVNNIPDALKADVIIDFSNPAALPSLLKYAVEKKIAIVVATTGLSKEDERLMQEASKKIPLFWSANMSLGVCLLKELAKKAAAFLGETYDIEIVEKHHNRKLDAPSGTALAIADAINKSEGDKFCYEYDRHSKRAKRKPTEIGISSVRGGNIVGDHEVIFAGQNEVIEITHKAMSRSLFADGAVKAAFYLKDKPAGFYDMDSLLAE
ncbi:MAG: 4-hydroxy-tetrahydrodipicolinate reductase [Ruminococcaceae bacterium]|nr:4-hydroxy-tetrahydrodipicolinate reductase [Oscillospiraceae bacterium]